MRATATRRYRPGIAKGWHYGPARSATWNVSAQVFVPAAMFSAAMPRCAPDTREANDPAHNVVIDDAQAAIAFARRSAIAVSCKSVLTAERPCSCRYCA